MKLNILRPHQILLPENGWLRHRAHTALRVTSYPHGARRGWHTKLWSGPQPSCYSYSIRGLPQRVMQAGTLNYGQGHNLLLIIQYSGITSKSHAGWHTKLWSGQKPSCYLWPHYLSCLSCGPHMHSGLQSKVSSLKPR